jgi:predicted nucleic acid-binding protein
MARKRKIYRRLAEGLNYFLIDANFLANKYIPSTVAPNEAQKRQIEKCYEWWNEIDSQLDSGRARVYICDLCIAEAFKVLAKKYYVQKWFSNPSIYNSSKKRLSNEITTTAKELSKSNRRIRYHDISTCRDIIIAVNRFFEVFLKNNLTKVSLSDLIILATAKYLIDFYDIPAKRMHIITLDKDLRSGAKYIQELPYIYDPTDPADARDKVFTS